MSGLEREIVALDGFMRDLGRKILPLSTASALNKTAALSKTRIIRGVSKRLSIKQKLIRRRVYARKATKKRQTATIRAYMRGISLIQLNPRDTGKGGWRKRRGRGVKARGGHSFPNAFIANDRNGRQQVFQRNGKTSRRDGRRYHHVDVVRVPIDDALEEIAPKVVRRLMASRFEDLLSHEIDYRLAKAGVR